MQTFLELKLMIFWGGKHTKGTLGMSICSVLYNILPVFVFLFDNVMVFVWSLVTVDICSTVYWILYGIVYSAYFSAICAVLLYDRLGSTTTIDSLWEIKAAYVAALLVCCIGKLMRLDYCILYVRYIYIFFFQLLYTSEDSCIGTFLVYLCL